jgi:hypothetical protein
MMMSNSNDRHFGLELHARPVYLIRSRVALLEAGGPDSDIALARTQPHAAIMAATEGPIPTVEEKNRIMTAKKELIQALVKRRALDKQLVR